MPSPLALGLLALAFFALALLPTRKLSLLGWRPGALLVYLVAMIVLGVAAIELRALARLLIPLALALLMAPFVVPPRWLVRLGRASGGAARDITPDVRVITPELRPGDADRSARPAVTNADLGVEREEAQSGQGTPDGS